MLLVTVISRCRMGVHKAIPLLLSSKRISAFQHVELVFEGRRQCKDPYPCFVGREAAGDWVLKEPAT